MPQIDSASDDRTANNVARHNYRTLTEEEKREMKVVKDLGALFIAKIIELDGLRPEDVTEGQPLLDRNLEIARQDAESAVMRAVRHITT